MRKLNVFYPDESLILSILPDEFTVKSIQAAVCEAVGAEVGHLEIELVSSTPMTFDRKG